MFTGAMHSYDTTTSDQVQHSGIPGKYSFASTSKRTILSSGCFKKVLQRPALLNQISLPAQNPPFPQKRMT